MSRFHERIGASRQIEITEEGADEYPNRQPGEVRLIVRVKPERVRHNAP